MRRMPYASSSTKRASVYLCFQRRTAYATRFRQWNLCSLVSQTFYSWNRHSVFRLSSHQTWFHQLTIISSSSLRLPQYHLSQKHLGSNAALLASGLPTRSSTPNTMNMTSFLKRTTQSRKGSTRRARGQQRLRVLADTFSSHILKNLSVQTSLRVERALSTKKRLWVES